MTKQTNEVEQLMFNEVCGMTRCWSSGTRTQIWTMTAHQRHHDVKAQLIIQPKRITKTCSAEMLAVPASSVFNLKPIISYPGAGNQSFCYLFRRLVVGSHMHGSNL